MRFDEIFARHLVVRIKPTDPSIKLNSVDVLAVKTTLVRGEFELRTREEIIRFVPVKPAEINQLTSELSTGNALLARLANPARDGSAELQITFFNGEQLEMGTVEIGIDEHVQSTLHKNSLDEAATALHENCIFAQGDKNYFFIVAGSAADTYLENKSSKPQKEEKEQNETQIDDKDDDNEVDNPTPSERDYRQFAIIGNDLRFKLSEKDIGFGKTIFLASGITRLKNRREDPALRLACGELRFIDWTKAGERAILAKAQLDKLTQDPGSYLHHWDEYSQREGDIFLGKARALGIISYSVKENKKNEIILQCKNLTDIQKEALANASELDAVDQEEIPPFLLDLNLTFNDYVEGILLDEEEDDFLGERPREKTKQQHKTPTTTFEVINYNLSTGEIRVRTGNYSIDEEENENSVDELIDRGAEQGKKLIYSVAGELAQIKRRLKARKAIQNQRCANPNLGLVIEDNGVVLPGQPPPKMKALSEAVRRKIFKNPPTPAQVHAIEVALNTPDIALIQGPPGTGKTTVIAAIIERLNQEADKREGISGKVLLSGFQHDAVENMIERINLNGLPVPKFGQRSGEARNADFSRFEQRLQDWCTEQIKKLKEKNPQIAEDGGDLKISCIQYIQAPSLCSAIDLLKKALLSSDSILGIDLRSRIQKELKHLEQEQNREGIDHHALSLIRRIRTTSAGFSDDGPERAGEVLYTIEDDLDEEEKSLLRQALNWFQKDAVPPFLEALRALKGKLLIRYSPAPIFRTEKVRDNILSLIDEVCNAIKHRELSASDSKNAALAELLLALETNPEGMVNTVKDYSFAFAATCQQSVNQKMQKMKGLDPAKPNQNLEYDYVIVDEAARVSPPDLMVAMAQGKRIILVGDHRQLPQLIDEDVAKHMEAGTEKDDEENNWLKESMFEYLFTERIEKLERADGIPRRVTLDMQYRTHPLLGEFISRNFYERHNPQERFSSGLSEDRFTYDLPDTNGKCAIWIDVPQQKGKMSRSASNTSWLREAEADVICTKLKEWIAYDNKRTDNPKERLTFGVISFYKAQTESIIDKLGKKYLDEVGDTRLRIGTVDSFQGMEFDVVFLSLVRTNGFGFLQLYNRLNVSMSRQKKLLVVVGDARHFDTDEAAQKVPGLKDFLKLCREKGAIL